MSSRPIEQSVFEHGLPEAVEAERNLLGACLLERVAPPEILGLSAADFFDESNRRIFRTVLTLHDLRRPIEDLTVAEILEKEGQLEAIGGRAYIAYLSEALPILSQVPNCIRMIRETAIQRRLALLGRDLTSAAIEREDPAEIIEQTIVRLEGARPAETEDLQQFTLAALDRQYQHHADHLDEERIRLGLGKFDDLTGGVAFGEIVTVLARTAVGKSAIAQNVIQNVLGRYGDMGLVFFSLEMPRLQVWERQLQIAAGIDRHMVMYGYRTDRRKVPADELVRELGDRMLIVDRSEIDLPRIKQFVRGATAAKLVKPVRFVAIDYLSLLDQGSAKQHLTERISVLARQIKQLAKELSVVVLLIAQTSRSAGDGSEEVGVLDARDSGAIEDSADYLVGCWRPELKKGITTERFCEVHGEMHFSLLKNRRGPRDQWTMNFDAKTLRVGPAA
jgi:replicative DNA helicase